MQSISPETIYRGNYAWEKSLPQITKLTKSPLILGRGIQTKNLRNNIFNDLKNQKLNVNSANLQFDCCYEDISRVKNIISNNNNLSVSTTEKLASFVISAIFIYSLYKKKNI